MLSIKFKSGLFQETPVNEDVVSDVLNHISKALRDNNISATGNREDETTYYFAPINSGTLFESRVKNKIKMEPGDKRIQKLGRDYLETTKLTQKQYDSMIEAIFRIFDDLKIEADITLMEGEESEGVLEHTLRTGMTSFVNNFPRPKTFPVEAK